MNNQYKEVQNRLEETMLGEGEMTRPEFYELLLTDRLLHGELTDKNEDDDNLVGILEDIENHPEREKLPTGTYRVFDRELSTPVYKLTLEPDEVELLERIIASSNFTGESVTTNGNLLMLKKQLDSTTGGLQRVHTEYRLEKGEGSTLSLYLMDEIYPKYSEGRVQYYDKLVGIGLSIVNGESRLHTMLSKEDTEGDGHLYYTSTTHTENVLTDTGEGVTLKVFGDTGELLKDIQELVKDVLGDEEKETLGRHKEEMSKHLNVIEERIRNKE